MVYYFRTFCHFAQTYHVRSSDQTYHVRSSDQTYHVRSSGQPYHVRSSDQTYHVRSSDQTYHVRSSGAWLLHFASFVLQCHVGLKKLSHETKHFAIVWKNNKNPETRFRSIKRNVIQKRTGNHEWTIQRHWQHWTHTKQDDEK